MRESWASRFGFIMATAGFAIGLGNIWRFPYMTGTNGGGAFLLVYLAIVLIIGVPLMTMEVGLGRRAQLSPIAGMAALTGSRTSPWNLIAWLGVIAATAMNAYYVMLIGWIMGYLVLTASGHFAGMTMPQLQDAFTTFISTPLPVVAYTFVAIVGMTAIVRRGLGAGLERLARVAMPVLFVLLVLLAVRSLTLPGALRGLAWYLTPDFSRIDAATTLAALGQAFYSIGIGMAAGFGFGSYLARRDSDVPGNTVIVVLCDTMVALLAGLVIFPALFAFDLAPDAGAGLLFVTMTGLFAQMPGGTLFGTAFFLLVLLAGVTSAIALFEVIGATLMDITGMTRRRATFAVAVFWMLSSTVVILGEGPWSSFTIAGRSIFGFIDGITANYMLPLGGFLIVLYTAYAWGFDAFRDEVNVGAGRFRVTGAWRPLVVAVIPLAVALVLLSGLGLLG